SLKCLFSSLLPVSSRARVRRSGVSPLHLAAEHDRRAVLSLLIESGFDVNSKLSPERSAGFQDRRVSALYCAVAARNTGAAAALLRAGADPNTDPCSPLLLAVRHGCLETVALLLEHGAHVNTGFPALLLHTHQLDLLQYLLDRGCDARPCFTCDTHHSDLRTHTRQRHTSDTDAQLKVLIQCVFDQLTLYGCHLAAIHLYLFPYFEQ
uniref:Uncharacterized protein n=1 Tax=Sinocyclocheilus grahami TaxID=75366 RepID=A0A672L7E5_SINGR